MTKMTNKAFFSLDLRDSINHVPTAYSWSFLWCSQCRSAGRAESNKDNFDFFLEGAAF